MISTIQVQIFEKSKQKNSNKPDRLYYFLFRDSRIHAHTRIFEIRASILNIEGIFHDIFSVWRSPTSSTRAPLKVLSRASVPYCARTHPWQAEIRHHLQSEKRQKYHLKHLSVKHRWSWQHQFSRHFHIFRIAPRKPAPLKMRVQSTCKNTWDNVLNGNGYHFISRHAV